MLTQENYKTVEILTISYVSSIQKNFQDKLYEFIKAGLGTSHSSHICQITLFNFLYKFQGQSIYGILTRINMGYWYTYTHTILHLGKIYKLMANYDQDYILHQQPPQERLLKAQSPQLSTKIYLPINKNTDFAPAKELEHRGKVELGKNTWFMLKLDRTHHLKKPNGLSLMEATQALTLVLGTKQKQVWSMWHMISHWATRL